MAEEQQSVGPASVGREDVGPASVGPEDGGPSSAAPEASIEPAYSVQLQIGFVGNIRLTKLLLEQLASAIHYLHSQNVLHRDIKPSNIFVTQTDPLQVTLADFGTARL